mmetsp:Transcript_90881/g.257419  ORF Transcript_90881/g.257419 Transcript_90881/m.257419 type:complete len:263 (-) Transcript_90881:258-1046(-)
MDGFLESQLKSAQLFESTEKTSEALVKVLKQACSRNRAIEKRQLWEQKSREDHGSATSISLKSRDGEVHSIAKVPSGAAVTHNDVNKFEQDRQKNADTKEDAQLNRFCDGQDNAWRPDSFFTDTLGDEDIPPWPMRPNELFTNPHLCMRIMAAQTEKKRQKKLEKRLKGDDKKGKKARKAKKDKKSGKKTKKGKKEKKPKKEKKEKAGKRRKQEKEESDDSDGEEEAKENASSGSSDSPCKEAAAPCLQGGPSSSDEAASSP